MFQQLSKKSLIIILFAFWCVSTSLTIYYAPSLKVNSPDKDSAAYIVNVEKIWHELPATKQLKEDVEKILEQEHQQFLQIESELKAEHQALLSFKKGTMPPQELQVLEKRKAAFEEKFAQTQKDVEAKQKSIGQRHNQATEKLNTIIQEKVKEVAQEHNAELILSSQNVIYTDPKRDLTSQVYEKVKAATLKFHME